MISFTGEWIGLKDIGLNELKATQPRAVRAVTKATLYYEAAVKKKLNAELPRTGRVYIIRGITHQASAPGEPPAPFSGDLRKSIGHEFFEDAGAVWGEVGTTWPYAAILEFGGYTHNGARILPRPYFLATFLEEEQAISDILETAVESKP